jgi:hypothetical protein
LEFHDEHQPETPDVIRHPAFGVWVCGFHHGAKLNHHERRWELKNLEMAVKIFNAKARGFLRRKENQPVQLGVFTSLR